jgi:hypothetical protein
MQRVRPGSEIRDEEEIVRIESRSSGLLSLQGEE